MSNPVPMSLGFFLDMVANNLRKESGDNGNNVVNIGPVIESRGRAKMARVVLQD